MNQENNVSSLQEHLVNNDISVWETALKLKKTVGFPYSDYKYFEFDWNSEEQYEEFIDFGRTASSISGRFYNDEMGTGYDTTIIFYDGKYFAQVEKDYEYGSTEYYNNSFPDYVSALKFAYGVVFND